MEPPLGLRPQPYRLILMIVTFVTAFVVAIFPFWDAPAPGVPPPPNYGAYGYTWSLALFAVPMAVLLIWLSRSQCPRGQKKAYWTTTGVTFLVWSLLDICFAHELFCFPNEKARIGLNVIGYKPADNTCSPGLETGWGWNVPIEEFLFYLGAVMVVLLVYMWAGERWFDRYRSDEQRYSRESARFARALQLNPVLLGLGVVLFLLCLVYKKTVPDPELRAGFPWYALFLIGIVVVPNGLLYRACGRLVNEPALLFTMTLAILVSVLWEVTLAQPQRWWAYQNDKTIGMLIHPWNDLPVEAAVLWFSAAWGNVTVYEIMRLYFHSPRSLRNLMTGRGSAPPGAPAQPVTIRSADAAAAER